MTLRYPTDLLPVPPDRWNAALTHRGGDDPDYARDCYTLWLVDASGTEEAERRVMSHIDHDYEDNLRGQYVSAEFEQEPGRWQVRVSQQDPDTVSKWATPKVVR